MNRTYAELIDEAVRGERIAALRREDTLISQIARLIEENRMLRSLLTEVSARAIRAGSHAPQPPVRSVANPGQPPSSGDGVDVFERTA